MTTLLSISALLITVLLMQMGTGALGPLDTLSGIQLGFTTIEIGIIGAAHFTGFIIGCFGAPALVRRVGHARAYIVTVALSVIAILLHPIFPVFWAWCLFRVFTGLAIATSFTAIESWLNAKLTKQNRGRFFSLYRMMDMFGALIAQSLIAVLIPVEHLSYMLLAIILIVSLLPLGLTKSVQPELPETGRLDPLFAIRISPLAVIGVLIVGATGSVIRMIGPLFAYESNLGPAEIGLFLSLFIIGGAVIQLPVGYLSERFSPRQLLGLFSSLTIIASAGINFMDVQEIFGVRTLFVLVFIFGLTTMPLYSICAIHANNLIPPTQMTALSASLIFIFAVGAIISPVLAGYLIELFGTEAMFIYFAALHVILLTYTGYRALIRPDLAPRRQYVYIPRTSLFIAKTIKSMKRRS